MTQLWRIAALLAIVTSVTSCGQNAPTPKGATTSNSPPDQQAAIASPEGEAFWALYRKVCVRTTKRAGSAEAEVDAIFEGYSHDRKDVLSPRDIDLMLDRHRPVDFDRNGCYLKTYEIRNDRNELDFFVKVLFDANHIAIGAQFGEYSK